MGEARGVQNNPNESVASTGSLHIAIEALPCGEAQRVGLDAAPGARIAVPVPILVETRFALRPLAGLHRRSAPAGISVRRIEFCGRRPRQQHAATHQSMRR